MKKSSTTMNVPVRTTGRGAHLLVRARAKKPGRGGVSVNACVLMASTVPPGARGVDYARGNGGCEGHVSERGRLPQAVLSLADHVSGRRGTMHHQPAHRR